MKILIILLVVTLSHNTHGLSVTSSDQTVREGADEVLLPCDYSPADNTASIITWNEVDDSRNDIETNIVTLEHPNNGRYSLRHEHGKGSLVISSPTRNDTNRRFECIVALGDAIRSPLNPTQLTVLYLDQPVISTSTSVNVYEGDPVILTCSKPDGDPVPKKTTWLKDDEPIIATDSDRYYVISNSSRTELHFTAKPEDTGNYTCRAESDAFRDVEGKNSIKQQITVIGYFICASFQSEADIVTCTAKGHPNSSYVKIFVDGELKVQGNSSATIQIDTLMCESLNIMCAARNSELDTTVILHCTIDDGDDKIGFAVLLFIAIMAWIILLLYYICYKPIKVKGYDEVTVEGAALVTLKSKYRPSIAVFSHVKFRKENMESRLFPFPNICGNCRCVCSYILRCCFYFCGVCCWEYYVQSDAHDCYTAIINSGSISVPIHNVLPSDMGQYQVSIMRTNHITRSISVYSATQTLDVQGIISVIDTEAAKG